MWPVKRVRSSSWLAALNPGHRSGDRYRRAGLTAISNAIARLVVVGGTFLIVPFALDHLGTERYGVWLTMSSFVGLLAFADLGLGNGLLTAISNSDGRDDNVATQSYVSSGFFMLVGAALFLGLVAAAVWLTVDVSHLFNLSNPQDASEAQAAVMILGVLLVGAIPLRLTEKVQWAIQEGYIAGIWQTAGALISLAGILVTIWLGGDLRFFALAFVGGPAMAAIANWIMTFGRRHRWMRPQWNDVSRVSMRSLLRLGAMFFGLQIAVAVAFVSDNLVVAQVLGPEHVPQLAVPFQMFAILSVMVTLMITPLWPAYGEAIARNDFDWVRKTFRRSVWGSLAITITGSIVLLSLGRWVIRVWAGPDIVPSVSLLWALAFLVVVTSVGNSIAMFLNGAGFVRFQLISATVMALAAVTLKIALAPEYGVAGVVWATVVSYSVFTIIPLGLYTRRLLSDLGNQAARQVSIFRD